MNPLALGLLLIRPSQVSVPDLKEDFKVFRQCMEEGHAGLYRYTPKAQMDRLFDSTEAKLEHPMSSLEFYRLLVPIVAAVKCGHSAVRPPRTDYQEVTTKLAIPPFAIRVVDGHPYVFRDLSDGKVDLTAAEILSINGQNGRAIARKMEESAAGDADVRSSAEWRLNHEWSFAHLLTMLCDIRAPYRMTFRLPSGRSYSSTYAGELPKALSVKLAKRYPSAQPKEFASLRFEDEGQVAILRVSSFMGFLDESQKVLLRDYFTKAFSEIQYKGSKSLIIDLRGNGGGSDDAGKQLLQHLIDRPFNYYSDLIWNHDKFQLEKYLVKEEQGKLEYPKLTLGADGRFHERHHPNWGTQQPDAPLFLGPLFVLADGGSFSTTCEFTSNLRYRRRVTFIGQETGGAFYGNNSGEDAIIELPHSQVMASIPLQEYIMAVSGEPKRRGVIPDVPIQYSIQELIAGKDKEMQAALRLARR